MAYPTNLDSLFNNHLGTDARTDHASLHNQVSNAIMSIQSKLGIDNSMVTNTIDYLLKKATSPGHKHTISELVDYVSDITNRLSPKSNITYVDSQDQSILNYINLTLTDYYTQSQTNDLLDTKVDKESGKGLSTNDFTTLLLSKLNGIEAGAEVNNISDINATDLTDGGDTSLHIHDSRYYTETEVNTLLSGKLNTSVTTDNITEGTTHLYDKVVSLLSGAGIGITGTYPNFTVSNSSPDQIVALTAGTNISITGTYPNFTINATGGGAVDSVNGQTGVVVLDADDISDAATTNKFTNQSDIDRLANTSGENTGDQDLSGLQKIIYDAIVAPTGGDYTLLSQAITAGKTNIFVKPGTYEEPTEITISTDGTIITGASKYETIINFASGKDGIRIYANNVVLRGLHLDTFVNSGEAPLVIGDGSTAGTPDTSTGNNNLIDDCYIRGRDSYGKFSLYFAGASYATGGAVPYFEANDLQTGNIVKNCIIEGNQAGDVAVFALQKNGRFENNTVKYGRIAFYMTRQCSCTGNTSLDSAGEGIFVAGPSWDNEINNNVIVSPTNSGIKTQNQLENTAVYPAYSTMRNTINGNVVYDAGNNGFQLEEADNNILNGNVSAGADNHCLYLQEAKNNNIVGFSGSNPRTNIGNARGSGIYLVAEAKDNSFSDITIEDSRVIPLMHCAIGNREGTDCTGNKFNNVNVKGSNSERTIWIQSNNWSLNNIYAEGGNYAGIRLDGASYCQLGNIHLKNNTNDANNTYAEFLFQNGASYNRATTIITESTGTNKAKYGIQLDSGCNYNNVLYHVNIGAVTSEYLDSGTGNSIGVISGGGTWGSITGTLSDQTDLQTVLNTKAPTTAATISATSSADALNLATAYDRLALNINPSVARTSYGVVRIKDDGTAANNGFRASFIIQGANNASALQPSQYIYNYSATPAIGLLIDHNNVDNPGIKVNKANSADTAIKIGKGVLEFEDGTKQSTAATGGSLSWGATASGTSGTGLTLTLDNSSSSGAIGQSIVVGNTQTTATIALNIDTGTSSVDNKKGIVITHKSTTSDFLGGGLVINTYSSVTQGISSAQIASISIGSNFNTSSTAFHYGLYIKNEQNGGIGRNSGIKIDNYSQDEPSVSSYNTEGAGLGIRQLTAGGTAFTVVGGNNINTSNVGLVNFTLSNTQSGATIMQKIDLGTSAQGHTGLLVNATGASTSQTGIIINLGSTGYGVGLLVQGTSTNASRALKGYIQVGNPSGDGFSLTTNNNEGTCGIGIYGANADRVQLFTRIGASANWYNNGLSAVNAGIGILFGTGSSLNYGLVISSPLANVSNTHIWNRSNFTRRTKDININACEYIKQTGATSETDNFNLQYFYRRNTVNITGGTLVSNGAVVKIENIATQTAGTLTDTVAVLKLTQTSTTSNGGHILFNAYTPGAEGSIPNNTLWYDGTDFKFKDNAGTVRTINKT